MTSSVFFGPLPFQPIGSFGLVEQRYEARLIDVHGPRDFDLGRARVCGDQLQQAGQSWPHVAVTDMAKVAAPDLCHREANVKSKQCIEGLCVERRPAPGFLAGFFCLCKCRFFRHRDHAIVNASAHDVMQIRSRSNFTLCTPGGN
jgi:hypothetical protein